LSVVVNQPIGVGVAEGRVSGREWMGGLGRDQGSRTVNLNFGKRFIKFEGDKKIRQRTGGVKRRC
jgi:hypothetical protein